MIDDRRLDGELNKAVEDLEQLYKKSIDNENFLEAAEYLKSLKAAGYKKDENLKSVYLKQVLKSIDDNAVTPALGLFQTEIINPVHLIDLRLKNEEIEILINAALENRNKAVLDYLRKNYSEVTAARDEEISEIINFIPNTEKLISATVTIWVNRGIRIEKGLGYPDRIIGSGFYIDSRGYIMTNYHVISSEVDTEYEGFSRLYIKYDSNEEKIPAKVVGWDASLDIALLKVEYTPEYFYNFSEPKEYKPGEKIYAIGSPGGLEKTITSGIVSASGNRRLLPIGDTIQVDVPINSGNSGGPVTDLDGNLVGVVFAGIEQFEGVNFIIPVKWILNNLTELYNEGRNRQSWLGLTIHEDNEGLEILYVVPGTSAFEAGLESGYEIIDIDGIQVDRVPDAQEIVQNKRSGTLLNILVKRDGIENNIMLVVEDRPDMPLERALELDSHRNLLAPFLGMIAEEGDEKILGQEYIIKKIYTGSIADETGLSVNDPFSIVSWEVDEENDIIFIGIRIKKKKAGFLETAIQLGNYIDINNTI